MLKEYAEKMQSLAEIMRSLQKKYFTKTLDLPKGIDLSPYYLALEIFK